MDIHTAGTPAPQQAPSIAFNLAGIAAIVLLLAVGAAYLIDELGHNERRRPPIFSDPDTIEITLSGKALIVPVSWFAGPESIAPGFADEVELRVALDVGQGVAPIPVGVTLVPRSRVRPSSALLDGVYLHQFDDATLGGVPGLVGKPLRSSNGYAGEQVWYDPLSPDPFVAKCMTAIAPAMNAQCLRTVYLQSGIAAVYAFDAAALPAWRQFDAAMQLWLNRIGAW